MPNENMNNLPKDLLKSVGNFLDTNRKEVMIQPSAMPGFGRQLRPEEIENEKEILTEAEDDEDEEDKDDEDKDDEDDEDKDDEDDEDEDKPSSKSVPKIGKKILRKPIKSLPTKSDKSIKLSGKKEKIKMNPELSNAPSVGS
jgi:ABC-type Zn2+ transport system substrate-binding protein/surface adhesin